MKKLLSFVIAATLCMAACKKEEKVIAPESTRDRLIVSALNDADVNGFRTLELKDFNKSPFDLMSNDWSLLLAESANGQNAMTIGWATFGILWGKPVVQVYVNPLRHTNGFMMDGDTFSLNFFDNSQKSMLSYMGSTSGRDEDKIAKAGLTVLHGDMVPYFEQSQMVILCKKIYAQQITEDSFVDTSIPASRFYQEKQFHWLYIGEIEKIMIK